MPKELELKLPSGVLNHLEQREWAPNIPPSHSPSRYAYYLGYHVGENAKEQFGGASWIMYDKLDVVSTTPFKVGGAVTLQPRLITRIEDPAWLIRVWRTEFGTTDTQNDTRPPEVEAPLSDERSQLNIKWVISNMGIRSGVAIHIPPRPQHSNNLTQNGSNLVLG